MTWNDEHPVTNSVVQAVELATKAKRASPDPKERKLLTEAISKLNAAALMAMGREHAAMPPKLSRDFDDHEEKK